MRAGRIMDAMFGTLLAGVVRRMGPTVAKALAVGFAVMLAFFVQWWQQQDRFVHVAIVAGAVTLVALWVRHRLTGQGVPRRRRRAKPVGAEPTQVLYRWWEPDNLPDGERCYCGKPRRAGELVYVGITGAHRSRELDDDRQASCWWRTGLIGTTETYLTRDAVERAEVEAIREERPRENKQHAVGRW